MARRSKRSVNPKESFQLPRNSNFGLNETVDKDQLQILRDLSIAAQPDRSSGRYGGPLVPEDSNISTDQLQEMARNDPEWFKQLDKTLRTSFSPAIPKRILGPKGEWQPKEPTLSDDFSDISDTSVRRKYFKKKKMCLSSGFADALLVDGSAMDETVEPAQDTSSSAEQVALPRRSTRSSRKLELPIENFSNSEIIESPREGFSRGKLRQKHKYSGKFSEVFDELRASSHNTHIEEEEETAASSHQFGASTSKGLSSPEEHSPQVSPSPEQKKQKSWKKSKSSRPIIIEDIDSPSEGSVVTKITDSPPRASAPSEETTLRKSPSLKERPGKKTSTGTPLRQVTLLKAFLTSQHPDAKDATDNISTETTADENSSVSSFSLIKNAIQSTQIIPDDSDSGFSVDERPPSTSSIPEAQADDESKKPRFGETSAVREESEKASPAPIKTEQTEPFRNPPGEVLKFRKADIRRFLLRKTDPSEGEEPQNCQPSGLSQQKRFDVAAVMDRFIQLTKEKYPSHTPKKEAETEKVAKPPQKKQGLPTTTSNLPQERKKKFELIMPDGKVYKCPKLARPKKFVTDKMYRFLMRKLEPQYDLSSRVKAEDFVADLCDTYVKVLRRKNHKPLVVHIMKRMVRLGLVSTYSEFYRFIEDFMTMDFRRKAIPCYGTDLAPTRTCALYEKIELD